MIKALQKRFFRHETFLDVHNTLRTLLTSDVAVIRNFYGNYSLIRVDAHRPRLATE